MTVGSAVGVAVGSAVGVAVGSTVGVAVGSTVGVAVGSAVGVAVGSAVGVAVGSAVGVAVAMPSPPNTTSTSRAYSVRLPNCTRYQRPFSFSSVPAIASSVPFFRMVIEPPFSEGRSYSDTPLTAV